MEGASSLFGSGTHLSALALETASALLSPLVSHLHSIDWLVHCSRGDLKLWEGYSRFR